MNRITNSFPEKTALGDIVEQAMCIGCGLCQGISGSGNIQMEESSSGYLHPVFKTEPSKHQLKAILKACPSRYLETLPHAEHSEETQIDPIWGPYQDLIHAWASDQRERYEGSTGGILTALAIHLLDEGKVDFILHAKASMEKPTYGERQLSFSREDVIQAAGSRYAPTAILIDIDEILSRGQTFAIIGKPCDISALRNYAKLDYRVNEQVKYWMTLVCGGFMPPEGTSAFLKDRGVNPDEVTALRYRGRGFPGPTHVTTQEGKSIETTYYDFWGEHYDRWTLPHRCKICPDSIGEAADIVAADPWPGGGPDLSDDSDPGTNVVISRTKAGSALLKEANASGAITLGENSSIEQMNDYQPHQVARKYTAWARLQGLKLASRIVPETSGLRIKDLAIKMDNEFISKQTEGTLQRVREGKATESRPEIAKSGS